MIYAFDEADTELTLMPMATRRALDAAGIKLSLASYQTLGLDDRRELVRLGAQNQVEGAAVRALVLRAAGADIPATPVHVEPVELPATLAAALGAERRLDTAGWRSLSALDRYVLDKLQRRLRLARLRQAYDEIVLRD